MFGHHVILVALANINGSHQNESNQYGFKKTAYLPTQVSQQPETQNLPYKCTMHAHTPAALEPFGCPQKYGAFLLCQFEKSMPFRKNKTHMCG